MLRPSEHDFGPQGCGDPEKILKTVREICAVVADDAVTFDLDSISVDRILEEQEYGGLRVKANATVDGARVRVVIDIGFGDAVGRFDSCQRNFALDHRW